MKKSFLIMTFVLISLMLLLGSCGKKNNEEDKNKDPVANLIYDADSELYLVYDAALDSEYIQLIASELDYNRNAVVKYDSTDSSLHGHEIVIGNTSREISKAALSRMEREVKNTDDDFTFLIYSDGSSVAIVWDECNEDVGVMADIALKYFYENYCKDTLVAEAGALYTRTLNIVDDHYRIVDKENSDAVWANFEKKYGSELTEAYRSLYSIYSPGCITWIANLYDPDICVCTDLYGESECSGTKYCGTGGFYYSNSGRDTLGYLPDVESTHQALNFLTSAGLAGKYTDIISDEMKKKIGDFVYALEEPNGYFYHPQWGIEFTDAHLTRRGRDLSWSCSILSVLGRTPKYTTASGMKGENARGLSSNLPGRLGSSVSAVSKLVLASETYAENLRDLEAFKEYLAKKDMANNSYGVGSEIGTQTSQIKERDKTLAAEGKPTIAPYLIEWLNERQDPVSGTWDAKRPGDEGYRDYHGTNGLLKISGIYNDLGVQMPYAMEAAKSAMADIINPAPISAVVDLYNTWFAIKQINTNLTECGGTEGAALVQDIRAELMKSAPEGIRVSREKISAFLKTDGSASYLKDQSSATNQGCPSAVPGTNEGDMNGATIAINGVIGNIASALGISKPALFGSAERYLFRTTIENLGQVTKQNDASVPEPLGFEYDKTGSAPEDLTVLETNKGTATVASDPTSRAQGKVLEIVSTNKGGDTIKLPVQNSSGLAKSFIFEGSFYIDEATSDYLLQLALDACYMLTFRQVTDKDDPDYGRIRLVESSSSTGTNSIDRYLGVTLDKDQWFKVRMEYYYGDDSTVRIKFYADTDLSDDKGVQLYAISDNYRDEAGKKVTNGVGTPSSSSYMSQIYVMGSASLKMYADDLSCYVSKDAYSSVLGKEDNPYFNIDNPISPEVKYDFEGGIPAGFGTVSSDNKISANDGVLSVLGGETVSTVTAPINVRGAGAKCASVSFDILLDDAATGKEVLLFNGMDGKKEIYGISLTCLDGADGKYITLSAKNESSVDSPAAQISVGKMANLRFDYYHREDVVLIYVDNVFLGATVKLYAEGNRRVMDSFRISTVKNSVCSVSLDNLVVEMNSSLCSDAISPDKSTEKTYDFENGLGDIKTSGKGTAVGAHGTDKALIMDSSSAKGSISVPVNYRADVVNSVIYSAKIDYTKLPASGNTHKISFTDKDNNTVLAFVLCVDGENVGLYEVGKGGRLISPLYSFKAKDGIELQLEIFCSSQTVHVMKAGKVVAKSSVFAGSEYLENPITEAVTESLETGSAIAVDDLTCESVYKVYKVVTPGSKNTLETDLTAGLSFDKSSSVSLPTPVFTLNYGDNSVGIRNVYNDITKEYTNALVIDKIGAGNDEVAFFSDLETSSLNAVAFEADIKMDLTSVGYAFRMSFGSNKKGEDAMYMLQIDRPSSNTLTFTDVSSGADSAVKNNYFPGIKGGEWFRLRIEFYKGDRDSVRFKVYVNGTFLCESQNFVGSHNTSAQPAALPKAAAFYFLGATRGSVYFDNVSVKALNQ